MAKTADFHTEVTRVTTAFNLLSRFVKAGKIGEDEARRKFADLEAKALELQAAVNHKGMRH